MNPSWHHCGKTCLLQRCSPPTASVADRKWYRKGEHTRRRQSLYPRPTPETFPIQDQSRAGQKGDRVLVRTAGKGGYEGVPGNSRLFVNTGILGREASGSHEGIGSNSGIICTESAHIALVRSSVRKMHIHYTNGSTIIQISQTCNTENNASPQMQDYFSATFHRDERTR
jgi:hypothetical protein